MKKLLNKKSFQVTVLGMLMMVLLTLTLGKNSHLLFTSTLNLPQHKAFDGTVYPVQLVPDWTHLSAERYALPYDSLKSSELVSTPKYDPNTLKTSVNDLKWGDPASDLIRNQKITYSTPYMGNYKLDGVEYAGSHPAVDIKVPVGTPVYSIANGVVIKVSNLESGFGHHIVIQHNNFPTLNNSSQKDVLYSSYNHLSDTLVTEGQVVTKGQQIAKSGNTGTSTTPHVHFQIDNSLAPWHPYWPFTWTEAQNAGLDFYTAINAGLGAENGKKLTVNPLVYVQTYLDSTNVNTNTSVFDTTTKTNNVPKTSVTPKAIEVKPTTVPGSVASSYVNDATVNSETNVEEPEEVVIPEETFVEVVEPVEEVVVQEPAVLAFDFDVDDSFLFDKNSEYKFKVLLKDQYGNTYKDGFNSDILIATENNKVRVDRTLATLTAFNDGVLENSFTVKNEGKDRFKIAYDGKIFTSDWFDLIEVQADSKFKDVSTSNKYYESISYLADNNVVNGYEDKTFRPNQTVTRVEALKFIFEGTKSELQSGTLPFDDLDDSAWYSRYLYTAVDKKVVKGYSDGKFRPNNVVTKAEFYKMLFNGMDITVESEVLGSPFLDVKPNDWFAAYMIKAQDLGIISKDELYVNPNTGMTRGEVAYAMYVVMTN